MVGNLLISEIEIKYDHWIAHMHKRNIILGQLIFCAIMFWASTTHSEQTIDGARLIGCKSWSPLVSPSNMKVCEIFHNNKMAWVHIGDDDALETIMHRGEYISFIAEDHKQDFKFDHSDYTAPYNSLYFTSKIKKLLNIEQSAESINVIGNEYALLTVSGVRYIKLLDIEDLYINKINDSNKIDYIYLPQIIYNDNIYIKFDDFKELSSGKNTTTNNLRDKAAEELLAESIRTCSLKKHIADTNLYTREGNLCTGLYLDRSTKFRDEYEYLKEICVNKSKSMVYFNNLSLDSIGLYSVPTYRYNDLFYIKENNKNKCLLIKDIKKRLLRELFLDDDKETIDNSVVVLEKAIGNLYSYKVTVNFNKLSRDVYFVYDLMRDAAHADISNAIYKSQRTNIFDILFYASITTPQAAEMFLKILGDNLPYSEEYNIDLIYLYAAMHKYNQNRYEEAIKLIDKYISLQYLFREKNKAAAYQIKAIIYSDKGNTNLARRELVKACKLGSVTACEYSKKSWIKLAGIYSIIKDINHIRNLSRL